MASETATKAHRNDNHNSASEKPESLSARPAAMPLAWRNGRRCNARSPFAADNGGATAQAAYFLQSSATIRGASSRLVRKRGSRRSMGSRVKFEKEAYESW